MTHFFTRSSLVMVLAVVATIWLFQSPVATQYSLRGGPAVTDNAPTPRTADGHPDMTGMWGGGGGGGGVKPDEKGNLTVRNRQRPCSLAQVAAGQCGAAVNFERDSGVEQHGIPFQLLPMYKPQYWEQVQGLDRDGLDKDPAFFCKPEGVPRMGPPNKIVQTPSELILLYAKANTFRVIPIDGRPHDPIKSQDTTWYGDAVGHWDGDTLVADIVGFNDESWLGWGGYFHTNNMRVIEKFTRKGNVLTWQATVEDPDVLLKPYELEPHYIRLNPDPKASFIEDLPCEERDRVHIVTKERG